MGKTRILFVRHGATVATQEDKFSGATDVLLSKKGEKQAEALSKRLASFNIAAIYCSPMKRTVKTATILAAPHKLELNHVPGIREISHGHWEEKTRAYVEEHHADEYISWDADPYTYAPEGGESGLQVLSRALPPIREIVERHPGETVLVVSHKATIRLVIGAFLGFDLRKFRENLDQQPCCLNIMDFTVAKPIAARLVLFNDVSHYESLDKPTKHKCLSKKWSLATMDGASDGETSATEDPEANEPAAEE